MEDWRPIPGYPKYFASADGRIKSERYSKPRMLKQFRGSNGYWRANVTGASGQFSGPVEVHQLVALAFFGDMRPDGLIVAHRNDNKDDNSPANLLWTTAKNNVRLAQLNGVYRVRGTGRLAAQTDEFATALTKRKREGVSLSKIAKEFGVGLTTARRKARSLGLTEHW